MFLPVKNILIFLIVRVALSCLYWYLWTVWVYLNCTGSSELYAMSSAAMIAILFKIKNGRRPRFDLRLDSEGHIHMYISQITILTNLNSPYYHDRTQDSTRFDTITIRTTILMMNGVCIFISICHRRMVPADWRPIFINNRCNLSVVSLDVDEPIDKQRGLGN